MITMKNIRIMITTGVIIMMIIIILLVILTGETLVII